MCYIIGKHVKVAPTEVIIKDNVIGKWNLGNNWCDADADRFVVRMSGRTAEEELTKAGFKDFKYPSTYGSKTGADDFDDKLCCFFGHWQRLSVELAALEQRYLLYLHII